VIDFVDNDGRETRGLYEGWQAANHLARRWSRKTDRIWRGRRPTTHAAGAEAGGEVAARQTTCPDTKRRGPPCVVVP
jgi:hypothetical protein